MQSHDRPDPTMVEMQVHDLNAAIAYYGGAFETHVKDCGATVARTRLADTMLILSPISQGTTAR